MADNTKRLSLDITEEQHENLNKHIPDRMKAQFFRALVEQVCDMFDKAEDPTAVVFLVLHKHIKAEQILHITEEV